MALVWRDVGDSGGGWFDDGTPTVAAPAPVLPSSLNGVQVDANPTQGSALWVKAGTYLPPTNNGVDATGSLAVSGIDSPTLQALGFNSWAAAHPDQANGVYDSSTQSVTSGTDLFLKSAGLDLYSHPIGAPGAELQATQAVDSLHGTAVGPQAIVSTNTGDDLVGKIWLGMAAAFTAGTALLAGAGTSTAELGVDEALNEGASAWDAGASSIADAGSAAIDAAPAASLAAPSSSSSALPSLSSSALPSLSQVGSAAGAASSLVGLAKQVGILPVSRTGTPVPSVATTSSSSAATTRGHVLLIVALVAGAFLLHKKGAL